MIALNLSLNSLISADMDAGNQLVIREGVIYCNVIHYTHNTYSVCVQMRGQACLYLSISSAY